MGHDDGPSLSGRELERYSRHLRMPELGLGGQTRLKAGKVLVIGTGGLGSPLAMYLAAAGVGTLGLVEFDTIDRSNLQRQVLYGEADLGKPKLWVAKARLAAQNPDVQIVAHEGPLTATNALALFADYDVIADGSDNFATRYLANDAAWFLGKPLVHAGIYRFHGQMATFWRGKGPCYRCLFPQPPAHAPSCSEGGVLGALAGTLGTMQATEVIKLLLGLGESLVGRLLTYDALNFAVETLALPRDPHCALCGDSPTLTALADYVAFCPDSQPDDGDDGDWQLTAAQLAARRHEVIVLDVREGPGELAHFPASVRQPLSVLAEGLPRLDPEAAYVAVCDVGSASAAAVRLLRAAGFGRSWHLKGGLLAWPELGEHVGLATDTVAGLRRDDRDEEG